MLTISTIKDEVVLRPVRAEDVAALQVNCWPERTPEDVALRLNHLISARSRRIAWGIVAELHGEPVAYGQLSQIGPRYEICNLIVSPMCRNRGLGTAIIEYFIEQAQKLHLKELEIGAAESNPRALSLYRRLGFHDKRQTRLFLDNKLESVIYLSMKLPDNTAL